MQLVSDAQHALNAAIGPAAVTETVNLHMIDKFEVPGHGFEVGKYLNVDGGIIPRWYEHASAACDMNLGQGSHSRDGYNKQIKIGVRPSAERVEISMSFITGQSGLNLQVVPTLEELHDDAVMCFELVITDTIRNTTLGGKK